MNLIIFLFAIFTYSECMKLSKNSLDSIRNVLSIYGSITEPESFLTDLDGLGRAFSHVNEEGSKKLAETLIEAYRARELDSGEIKALALEAIRVGNVNAKECFSRFRVLTTREAYIMAASNGQVDILYQIEMSGQSAYHYRNEMRIIVPGIIRAGHLNVLRWYFARVLLFFADARKILVAAIGAKNEKLIKLLLDEQKYFCYNISNNLEWLTYEECIRMNTFFHNELNAEFGSMIDELVLFKGAKFGSITVVRFFLERELLTSPDNIEHARYLADKNGHTDILDLIRTYSMLRSH